MRPVYAIVFLAATLPALAFSEELNQPRAPDSLPSEANGDSVNHGMTLWFETINYATLFCKNQRDSVHANLIAQGVPMTSDPSVDAAWMKKKEVTGGCWKQPPNERFVVTAANPVYLNNSLVVWTVGVKSPKTGATIGYVPIDNIRILPVPTL